MQRNRLNFINNYDETDFLLGNYENNRTLQSPLKYNRINEEEKVIFQNPTSISINVINIGGAKTIPSLLGQLFTSPSASSNQGSGDTIMKDNLEIKAFFNKLDAFMELAPEGLKTKFLNELFIAVKNAFLMNDIARIAIFVDDWFDTIDIYSSIESKQRYEEAVKELDEGKGIQWIPGMYSK